MPVLFGADSLFSPGAGCVLFLPLSGVGVTDTFYVATFPKQGWGDSIHRQPPVGFLLPQRPALRT